MIMRIAGRPVSGTFCVVEIAGVIAPDARQQPVERLNAIPALARRPIGLSLAAASGSQQDTCENQGKKPGAHGFFVRPGT